MALRCPICNEPVDPQSRAVPFCTSRCKQIDLSRWLGEEYGLPYESPYSEEEDDGAGED